MILIPDLVNASYEAMGGLMNLLNVKTLRKDKKLAGVRILPSAFFTSWGLWNLYYYPHLGQWLSFTGGLFLFVVNMWWIGLAFYYRRMNGTEAKEI